MWMCYNRAMLPNLSKVASLIGDPVRSRMLFHLLDGHELSASDLASRSAASPQAASAHLAKLVDGGLLFARTDGRRRYFRLASVQVAHAIEALASIAPVAPVNSLTQHTAMQRLREARSCYDHLAGRLGVHVTEALVRHRIIRTHEDEYRVTASGEIFFANLGIDLDTARAQRRHFARICLDWTERRSHLAGALGASLFDIFIENRWVLRNARDRALAVSADGHRQFKRLFGFDLSR